MATHCSDDSKQDPAVKLTINMEPTDPNPRAPVKEPSQIKHIDYDSIPEDGSAWRPYHDNIREKMKVEFLLEAMRTRERPLLEKAIQEAREPPSINLDDPALHQAEFELQVAIAKEDLRAARKTRQPHAIRQSLDKIPRRERHVARLQPDIAEANSDLVRLEHMIQLRRSVLDMDMKTMSEIRRYHKPPLIVHDVMKGVMLLFGEDEDTTSDWRVCQQALNPHGRTGMNRRVLNFDPGTVHPQLAARVREILEEYRLSRVQTTSPGTATFYVWAMGMVDLVESMSPSRGSRPKPADRWRQKEIFGRTVEFPHSSPRAKRRQLPMSSRPQWK